MIDFISHLVEFSAAQRITALNKIKIKMRFRYIFAIKNKRVRKSMVVYISPLGFRLG